jgi:hypothetical protein
MPLGSGSAERSARPASETCSVAPKSPIGWSYQVPGPSSSPSRRTTPRPPARAKRSVCCSATSAERRIGRTSLNWRVLGRRAFRRVDKRDSGLDVDRRAGRDRRVDEDPRGLRASREARRPWDRLLAGAFGARHLRAVEPVTSGAYGEGPVWRMGVTFGVSIVRAACSCGALLASGRHPRPRASLDPRLMTGVRAFIPPRERSFSRGKQRSSRRIDRDRRAMGNAPHRAG